MSSGRERHRTPGQDRGDSRSRPGNLPPSSLGRHRIILWILVLLLVGIWVLMPRAQDATWTPVAYSTFRELVEEGRVERVEVQGSEIRAVLDEAVETSVPDAEEPERYDHLVTHLPYFGDDTLLALLEAEGVEIRTEAEADFSWWLVLVYLLPVALIVLLFVMIFRGMRAQGQQMMSIGENRARAFDREDASVTFGDVAGQMGAKQELEELVAFLKDPSRFERLGGEIPRGFLLVGPPGTGKTLLARAVAGEAGVPFFHMSGSDFMEMLVGVGASRVRNLFKEAKESAPSIVFIDELDSVGRKRGAGLGGGHDEREQTLNQLLSEMDGFEPNEGVVVIAATNRPDILDPAILRPGRFDRRVTLDLPTREDREAILKIHARRKPLASDVDLGGVARGTPGFSGADLRNLLNESALLAARKERERIGATEIEEARDKILLGLERSGMTLTDEDRELLAYHEAGHATLAALLPHADPVHKVTIVPRGRAMGVTQQLPDRDRFLYSRSFLEERLIVLLGGRAAEELVLGTRTSGAEDDLRQASQIARKMVLSWGMSEGFGRIASSERQQEVFLGEEIAQRREFSDSTAREVDQEVRGLVEGAFRKATDLLREHRASLDRLATALLEREEVSGREVLEIMGAEGAGTGLEEGQPAEEEEAAEAGVGRGLLPGADGSGPPEGVRAMDHTADVGLEVEAPDLPTLFERAAAGAIWLVTGLPPGVADGEERDVDLEAGDLPGLLRSWLREVLYWQEVEGFALSQVRFRELGDGRIRARVTGGLAPAEPAREIKGVTWHGLAVEESGSGWVARVIFDV